MFLHLHVLEARSFKCFLYFRLFSQKKADNGKWHLHLTQHCLNFLKANRAGVDILKVFMALPIWKEFLVKYEALSSPNIQIHALSAKR